MQAIHQTNASGLRSPMRSSAFLFMTLLMTAAPGPAESRTTGVASPTGIKTVYKGEFHSRTVEIARDITPEEARRAAENYFRRWERAIANEDPQRLADLVDPGGCTVMLDGTRWPFKQMKSEFKSVFAETRNMRTHIRIDRFAYSGGEASVWMTSRTSWESRVKGRWVKETSISRSADTLRRFPGGWKCVFSQALP